MQIFMCDHQIKLPFRYYHNVKDHLEFICILTFALSYYIFISVFTFRCGNYFIREAMPSDKEDVLNIRKNLYGGLDYMPDCYDKLVSIPNGKAFVAIHEDKVVSNKCYKSSNNVWLLYSDSQSCKNKYLRSVNILSASNNATFTI